MCDKSLMCHGLNSNPIFVSCGESHLLVLWCAGDRRNMAGSDEDRGRSR
jgi:hypothetical protein